MKFWFKAALLVAAAVIVPACKSNAKLAAPSVVAVLPAAGANTGIGAMPNIIMKFDREMDVSFVSDKTRYAVIKDGDPSGGPITVEYLPAINEVRIIPSSFLTLNKGYTVLVSGAVKSAAGTPLGNNVGFTFTTTATNNATGFIGFGAVTQAAGGTPGQVVLSWPTATESTSGGTVNVTTYDIYVSDVSGGQDFLLPPSKSSGNLTGDTITEIVPGTPLVPGTTYFIKVQPRDGSGNVFTSLQEVTVIANP